MTNFVHLNTWIWRNNYPNNIFDFDINVEENEKKNIKIFLNQPYYLAESKFRSLTTFIWLNICPKNIFNELFDLICKKYEK